MKKLFMIMGLACAFSTTQGSADSTSANERILDSNYRLPVGNGIAQDPLVSVWASIKDDPQLAPYASSIDYMMCGGTVIIFGLVDSQEIKNAIERKVRPFAAGRTLQNKIIVKTNSPEQR